MSVPNTKNPSRFPSAVRFFLYILLTLVLLCGGFCLWFYLTINWEYIRSDFAASQAQGQIERLYEQMQETVPDGAVLVSEKQPESRTYACGLSAGSSRYANVRAYQIYQVKAAFSEVLESYKQILSGWGWQPVALDSEVSVMGSIFEHPNDSRLLVGICLPPGANESSGKTKYTVFLDFDEATGCSERCWGRLCLVVARYCES